jgi:guanylate kinase
VRLIKQNHPDLDPVFVFISPPSLEELRSRLVGRGTETDEAVKARLETALNEIAYVKDDPKVVNVVVVNDELDRAYNLLETIALGNEVEGDTLPDLTDRLHVSAK